MTRLKLNIALGTTGLTEALKSGLAEIKGVEPEFANVVPIIGAFREMVRHRKFDVCEMAPTTYLIAKTHGARFTALPIVLMRRFHHDGLIKHPSAGIEKPSDLAGCRIGVRAYSVTTGVWTRGILQDDYGLDPGTVTWVVDDEEHVETLRLPANVEHVGEGETLAGLFEAGMLDAAFTANAGIGRIGAPTGAWKDVGSTQQYAEVIDNPGFAAAEWFKRSGVYPIHSLVVVKDELLEEYPWLGRSLLDAFEASKRPFLARLHSGDLRDATDRRYAADMAVVGDDPLAFGLEETGPAIDLLVRYAVAQKLIAKPTNGRDLFYKI